eukprot:scaffold4511_cov171-Amphora_coffeaeformis.AAC.12
MSRRMDNPRNNNNPPTSSGTDLLNFRFANPAPVLASSGRGGGGRGGRHYNNNHRNNQRSQHQDRRTKEDRSSARRKASAAMFYLHSSADHQFILSRRPHKSSQQPYSFSGSDAPVSWACVLMVKQLSSLEFEETCPICLEAYTAARITKCGHSFCLPCLLHHSHAFSTNYPYAKTGPKCPCCSIELHLDDVRPVQFVDAPTPAVSQTVRLIKLHRVKGCAAPFLPQPHHPRRAAPHAAPGQCDADALFTRFNYVDLPLYQAHLTANLAELEQMEIYSDMDEMCRTMALNMVRKQLQESLQQVDEELEYMERFGQPSSGVYQPQPPHLVADNYAVTTESSSAHGAERTRSASMGSESNYHDDEEHSLERCRSESIGSEPSGCLERGDSIVSHDSNAHNRHGKTKAPCSMYLGPEESVFYQAEDGRLCFLCGFDITCLRADYADALPEADAFQQATTASQRRKLTPLPDFIEGRILEIEHVHLTPEKRQRLRFLSHLPLYADICFVELSLGNLLSKQTKKSFAKDFQKRINARMKKAQMEKREDKRAQRQEEARINELKARMQRIDPNDEFFQPVIPEPEPTFDNEDFGPSILGDGAPRSPIISPSPSVDAGQSFSQIIRQGGGGFPSLSTNNEAAFPALGSSPPTNSSNRRGPPPPAPWGAVTKSVASPPGLAALPSKKKKGSGKKIVLFSTGGQRDVG